MTALVAACWGLIGGASVEGLELYTYIRRTPGWTFRQPIPQGLTAYIFSLAVRAVFSAAPAAALAASGEIISAFTAFGYGVGAPLILEKVTRSIPLSTEQPTPPPAGTIEQHGGNDAG